MHCIDWGNLSRGQNIKKFFTSPPVIPSNNKGGYYSPRVSSLSYRVLYFGFKKPFGFFGGGSVGFFSVGFVVRLSSGARASLDININN